MTWKPVDPHLRGKVIFRFEPETAREKIEKEIVDLQYRIDEAHLGADHFGHNAAAVALANHEAASLQELLIEAKRRLTEMDADR